MAFLGTRSNPDIFKEPAVFIKIPEIILLFIAIITFFVNNDGSPAFVASVLLPCLLNAVVFLTANVLGYTQQRQTPVELALYSYYVIGMFISSILLMSRTYSGSLIASGVFCLFLTFIYCAEVYFSYLALLHRPSDPPNTTSTPAPFQQPVVIGGPDLGVYPGVPPPTMSMAGTLDYGIGTPDHHNPVYPTTMNYPPYPVPDTNILPGPAP